MTSATLAQAYLEKARLRREVLDFLMARGGWSDVVREAQELVELACKGMLRHVGVEPPKWHDVGGVLLQEGERFSPLVQARLGEVAAISKALRKEREFAFYGDEDFVPTEAYDRGTAEKAVRDAAAVLAVAERVIAPAP